MFETRRGQCKREANLVDIACPMRSNFNPGALLRQEVQGRVKGFADLLAWRAEGDMEDEYQPPMQLQGILHACSGACGQACAWTTQCLEEKLLSVLFILIFFRFYTYTPT